MKKIKLKDKIDFLQELSSLYNFGLTVTNNLDQFRSKVGQLIKSDIKCGKSISTALEKFNFEREVLYILRAGEVSGSVQNAISNVLDFYKKKVVLKKRVIKALVYPVVTIIFAIVIVSIFSLVILPKFNQLYSDMGLSLNSGNDFKYAKTILAGLIVVISAGCYFFWDQIKEKFILKLKFVKQYFGLYFFNILNFLYASGCDVNKFLNEYAKDSFYRENLHKLIFYLKKGVLLSDGLKQSGLLEHDYYLRMQQAEAVADLSGFLKKFAVEQEEQFFGTIDRFVMLLEPMTIIFVGIFIGYLSYSILVPIMNLTQHFM